MDTIFYAFAALLFAAVIFLLEGVYTWWSTTRSAAAKRLERRLQLLSAGAHGNREQESILKQRYLKQSPLMEQLLLRLPRIHAMDRILEQSGTGWSPARFLTYSMFFSLFSMTICIMFQLPTILTTLAGLTTVMIPLLYILQTREKRFRKFELQLPEAADLISRALKAGHAFPSTMQMLRDEMPEPVSGEFRIVADEINYGVPLNDALMNLSTRIPLTDLRYFIIAVLIQRESGGNLAEILENIAQIIRERLKLLSRIRVLSAEGKLSAWILGLLPFAVGFFINLVNPGYLHLLWVDPLGITMVTGALMMMIIGAFVMRKIIRIRV